MAATSCRSLEDTSEVVTTTTYLTTNAGFHWTIRCISDPQHANILCPSTPPIRATIPGSLLDELHPRFPDPFLRDNSLNPVFSKLEHSSFCYQTSFHFSEPCTTAPFFLFFDCIDTVAAVYLNSLPPSEPLLRTENSFHPHVVCIPASAFRHGLNTLYLIFTSIRDHIQLRSVHHTYKEWNDPVGGISTLRTPQFLAGWDWGPRMLACSVPGDIRIINAPIALLLDVAVIQHIHFEDLLVELTFIVEVAVCEGIDSDDMLHIRCQLLPPDDDQYFPGATDGTKPSLNRCNHRAKRSAQVIRLASVGSATSAQHTTGFSTGELGRTYAHKDLWNVFHLCPEDGDSLQVHRYIGKLTVDNPLLWWPNGYGEQHMYTVRVLVESKADTLPSTGSAEHAENLVLVDDWEQRIGLRKLELIRESAELLDMCRYDDISEDVPSALPVSTELHDLESKTSTEQAHGQSFVFAVNGRKIFAKGANYIPLHILYSQTTNDEYERVIQSAQEANMNMLRVWGGGIYESEAFYDACDRMGILVWQDFMFSCSLYPGDQDFLKSCRREIQYQVSRLRNRACLALWCGNNELEQVPHDILKTDASKEAYESLFYATIPDVIKKDPTSTPYWPSSPHNPDGYQNGFNNPRSGDTHFWDVCSRHPVSSYLKHRTRFCSEFGMQSYLSEAGAVCFAGSQLGSLNPGGPIMEAHQKKASGNLIIQEYCQRLFRTPRDYASLAYQSQLNQLICIRTGVEHFRRSWPYCGGALYWQLNDCWPCCSWSSIEYGGNLKALHYGAKSFFAPLLVSMVHHGKETVGVCNLTSFTKETGKFSVYACWDGTFDGLNVTLKWEVVNVKKGTICERGRQEFVLEKDSSKKLMCLDVSREGDEVRNPRQHIIRVELESKCERFRSSATGWLCSPRLCDLNLTQISCVIEDFKENEGSTEAMIRIESTDYAPFVEVFLSSKEREEALTGKYERYEPPTAVKLSNNFFDLFPKEARTIWMKVERATTKDELESQLMVRSLVDSYMD